MTVRHSRPWNRLYNREIWRQLWRRVNPGSCYRVSKGSEEDSIRGDIKSLSTESSSVVLDSHFSKASLNGGSSQLHLRTINAPHFERASRPMSGNIRQSSNSKVTHFIVLFYKNLRKRNNFRNIFSSSLSLVKTYEKYWKPWIPLLRIAQWH